jgi:menaquinone-9 beta-reductase
MNPPDVWDAVIVGAGPAGGVAAALLAERGASVLLVEKSDWPRDKVCGGCLSAPAVRALASAGLGHILATSQRINQVAWQSGGQSMCLDAPGGAAISRGDFDGALIAQAIRRGCRFSPRTGAQLLSSDHAGDYRELTLTTSGQTQTIKSHLVLACDGIGGTFLANEPWAQWTIARNAWMGVSTTCPEWPGRLASGTIYMQVGHGGYVGLVRLGDGQVHLAAALDPAACRRSGGPARLVEAILFSRGRDIWPGLTHARFRGSGALTRRRSELGNHRILAIGDACGYAEPFTGEGMAWAIAGAIQVVQMLPAELENWPIDLPRRWQARHAATIAIRQKWCKALRLLVHHPLPAAAVIAAGRAMPFLAARLSAVAQESAPEFQGGLG